MIILTRFYYLILIIVLFACQREIVFETNTAQGTLKSQLNGDCLPAAVSGMYKKDTALTINNYIEIQAHFVNAGSYTIYSDTLNGYYFRSEGITADTGLQTIRLAGSGTPVATGVNNFSIRFENSICRVSVAVAGGTNNTSAIFTLGLSGNNCTGILPGGSFIAGLSMNNQNTIKADVNVTTVGNYNITTTTANGVSFAASGIFSTPGNQQVTLYATGTPQNAGSFNYTINSGSSQCQFSLTYTPNTTAAVYTTNSTGGLCAPITINGIYKAGVPLNATNTINVQVNVTTPGTYSITTAPAVNGIVFNGSGNFTTTGNNTVTLFGNGTPILAGTNIFTIAGATGCNFPLKHKATEQVLASLPVNLTVFLKRIILMQGARLSFPSPFLGQAMELMGKATDTTAENLYIALNKSQAGTLVTNGNYGWGTSFNTLQFYYYDTTAAFWYGISTINMEYLTISSITATRVTGTFSGKVYIDGGWGSQFKVITEGQFDLPIQ
ncbi:MAG: hypothetical protein IPQ25_14020 [Chitinophagaceae bacterium]|nr:hypothetical protein [Chitinophagaceae bacterium]